MKRKEKTLTEMVVGRKEVSPGDFLMEVYTRLYNHFGPRHWWPAETPFEVVVGAILTQSVAWRNVEKAIVNLKEAGLLSVEGLHQAEVEEIASLIVPTRYYRAKAKKLKAFINFLVEKYGGSLERLFAVPLDKLRPELLGLNGIGPETADSILLYAGEYPIFVIDAYTHRIFQRLGVFEPKVSYAEMQRFFMYHLPTDVKLFNEYHALIDALGNRLCRARKPTCQECPLLGLGCQVSKDGNLKAESLTGLPER